MRVLVAHPGPAFSVHDVYVGWVEALRELGVDVYGFNLGERLQFYAQAELRNPDTGDYRYATDATGAAELAINGLYASLMKVRPHLLLIVSAFFVPSDLMTIARAAGVRVAVLHTESPYEDHRQVTMAAHADLNVLNDPTNLDHFRAVAPTIYLPHAYRPSVHAPGLADPGIECDFGFVGTGYPSRIEFFEAMDLDGLAVRFGGNWLGLAEESPLRRFLSDSPGSCVDNVDAVRWYRSTRVGINLYRQESEDGVIRRQGWSVGPREVELAACGAFFLRESRPEGNDLLSSLPVFSSPEEAGEMLRWWLARSAERETAAAAARAAVASMTFTGNARRLLSALGD